MNKQWEGRGRQHSGSSLGRGSVCERPTAASGSAALTHRSGAPGYGLPSFALFFPHSSAPVRPQRWRCVFFVSFFQGGGLFTFRCLRAGSFALRNVHLQAHKKLCMRGKSYLACGAVQLAAFIRDHYNRALARRSFRDSVSCASLPPNVL